MQMKRGRCDPNVTYRAYYEHNGNEQRVFLADYFFGLFIVALYCESDI